MQLKFVQTRLFRLTFLCVCILLAIGIMRSVVTIWQKQGIVAERRAVLEAEQSKHAQLEAKLREATGAAFIERQAREKLGLVKEGETVVIMDKSSGASRSAEATEILPLWKQWWKLFF